MDNATEDKTKTEPDAEMTKEEKKFLIRALWETLVTPRWTKNDLIDLGMAIFSKKTLKEMDDRTFEKILPFLETMAVKLWQLLGNEAARQSASNTTATTAATVAANTNKKPDPESEGETNP